MASITQASTTLSGAGVRTLCCAPERTRAYPAPGSQVGVPTYPVRPGAIGHANLLRRSDHAGLVARQLPRRHRACEPIAPAGKQVGVRACFGKDQTGGQMLCPAAERRHAAVGGTPHPITPGALFNLFGTQKLLDFRKDSASDFMR